MTDLTEATEVEVHRDGYPTHRRKVRFDWSNTPLHWVPDDPFSTHMMNVLHLLLPAGERWFIQVVNEAAPMVDDPELKAAIKPFIQQESWHAWAHQVVLDHLAEQGIDTKSYTDKLQKWLQKWLSRWVKRIGHVRCSGGGFTGVCPTSPRWSTSPRCWVSG